MPAFINGYRNTTYILNNPGTQNPATVGTSGFVNVNSTASGIAGILGALGTAGTSTYAFAWTLTNNGTVQSVGNGGVGVDLRSGGTITNAPAPSFGTAGPGPLVGGIIGGSGEGVDISGAAGSISNSGTIQQIGTSGSNGVYLRAGGTISNTGTISSQANLSNGVNLGGSGSIVNGVSGSNTGLISGYITGVYIRASAPGSVINNYGTIQSTKANYSFGLFGEAVQLRSQATLNNFGTITAGQTKASFGVLAFNGGAITNAGGALIQASGIGIEVTGTAAAALTNAGTVRVVGTNLGTGGVDGILTIPGNSTVTNTGTVFAGAFGGNANGIQLAGGMVVNSGLINAAYGSNDTGVTDLSAAGDTVVNTGTILAAGTTTGTGVNLNAGSVSNTGLISGTTVGVAINAGGAGTVTNSGTIQATTTTLISNTVILTGGRLQNSGVIANASHNGGAFAVQIGNAAGAVVNQTGALISAYHTAIISGTAGGPSNVTNYGTIRSTASLSSYTAIQLRAGGSIINGTTPGSGALIAGGIGVIVSNAAGTLSNFGTISGTAGTALNFRNGGSVNNAGLITASATGVFLSGAGEAVVNSGSIVGASAINLNIGGSVSNTGLITSVASGAGTVTGFGVNLGSGGTVSNSGTISSPSANNGSAINVGSGGGTIVNAAGGLITGYHIGIGFFSPGTLTLANYGTIRSTQTGPAAVTGFNGFGVQTGLGSAAVVDNFGIIAGSQTAGGGGVLLTGGGTLTNHAGARIDGKGGNAVTVGTTGAALTVINSGTLVNSSTTNSLVYLGAGGSVTNNAGALISANGSTNAVSSPAGGIVTNSGIIIAAVGNGVRLAGAVGTVINSGLIQSNGSAACGIYVLAGGSVSNTGLVQGTDDGVHAVNQPVNVVNFGSIVSTTTGTGGRAVLLSAGGTVTNYGLISGSRIPVVTNGVTGYAAPVEISNATGLVVNVGTIATTNIANGVNILAGGGLVNGSPTATGATISASHTGVYIGGTLGTPTPGALGLVANYGTITNSGTGGGVSLASGGDVDNHGLIISNGNGVSLRGTTSVLTNFGTIQHTGAGTVGEAVYLGAGGVVTNYGLISGARAGAPLPTGYPGALEANNQPVFVTNLGTVANLNNGNGVNLLSGGTLVNGSPNDTAAAIFAPRGGVYIGGRSGTPIAGALGTVVNYGAIINSGSAAAAIRMVSGGTVTNRGGISSGRTGISFANTAGTIDNSGIIVSTAATSFTSGAGVYLQNGGQITNEAGGSITAQRAAISLGGTTSTTADVLVTNSGVLTGDVGIKVGLADTANNTIVNFGTITGTSGTAIDLGNDSASIVLEPGSSLNGAIANFHAGDSIDFPTLSAFSLNYANGTLTLFNQTTPVAQLAVSTPYVNPQFSEAPDGSGGTVVTVTPPGGPVMFDFIYRYNGSGDYYYGKVADDGSFGYSVGQQISTGIGTYTVFNEEPGAVGLPAGSVFITYVSHAGFGETSTTPLKFGGGQPAGTNGLGSESDAVIGTDGQPHPFGSAAPPSFPVDQLFGFIFSYADGSSFYTGTVADDGSFGYGAIADGSGVKQIFDSSGKFQGYYTIYREGPTDQPAGKVIINRYFSGQTGQAYDVDQSVSGGTNGLSSETGVIVVNGQQVTFGDPPEAVLPVSNPALAVLVVDTANPTIAAAQIYEQILGRAPDSAGLTLYAGALAHGASVSDVQSMIAHSPEAQHDINLMFQQVLGRDADSSGLADYQNALAGGASLGNLRALLGQSPEAQNDLNQLYRQVLGRDADNGGAGSYTGLIANGASLQDVRASLAHSQEAQNDLNLVYQQVLGRDGDSGGLGNYQNALASGWSLDGVRAEMLHSAEAQSDLARLFNGALGRDPTAAELAGAESRLTQGGSLQGLQNDLLASGSAGGFTAMAAGGGDMTLAAATGPTSFLFNNAVFGNDTILGFDVSQDAIVLGRVQAPDFPTVLAEASQTGSGTLIALGPTQSILLNGVPLSSLHANNFQFV